MLVVVEFVSLLSNSQSIVFTFLTIFNTVITHQVCQSGKMTGCWLQCWLPLNKSTLIVLKGVLVREELKVWDSNHLVGIYLSID